MIRRPPRSTLDRSSAASDVYKRQAFYDSKEEVSTFVATNREAIQAIVGHDYIPFGQAPVSYTHLRAHETVLDLVCRLLLEKKNKKTHYERISLSSHYHDEHTKSYITSR